MVVRSIASALGFLILSLSVSGCALLTPKPREIEISTKPVEKPRLELPKADQLRMRNVEWVVITKDNYKEVFETIAKSGKPVAIFGLTDQGYANLGLNFSDIRAYVQQQKAIIAAYERYYKEADEKLNEAVTVDKKDKK